MRRGAAVAPVYHYIGATARAAADGWESLGDIGYLDARRLSVHHRPHEPT